MKPTSLILALLLVLSPSLWALDDGPFTSSRYGFRAWGLAPGMQDYKEYETSYEEVAACLGVPPRYVPALDIYVVDELWLQTPSGEILPAVGGYDPLPTPLIRLVNWVDPKETHNIVRHEFTHLLVGDRDHTGPYWNCNND